jgi:hypothetical protein
MAVWRSNTGTGGGIGWMAWAVALAAAWLVPPAVGLVLVQMVDVVSGDAALSPVLAAVARAGFLLTMSLMLSALWLLPLAALVWALLRYGAGGWLSVALSGVLAGGLGILAVPGLSFIAGASVGLCNALVLWFVLSRMRPQIFTVH